MHSNAASPADQVRFGQILKGQDFLRAESKVVVWRRTQGAFGIRVDHIGEGKCSWPIDVAELVTPVIKSTATVY